MLCCPSFILHRAARRQWMIKKRKFDWVFKLNTGFENYTRPLIQDSITRKTSHESLIPTSKWWMAKLRVRVWLTSRKWQLVCNERRLLEGLWWQPAWWLSWSLPSFAAVLVVFCWRSLRKLWQTETFSLSWEVQALCIWHLLMELNWWLRQCFGSGRQLLWWLFLLLFSWIKKECFR